MAVEERERQIALKLQEDKKKTEDEQKRKKKEKKRLKKYQNKNKISFGDDEELTEEIPKVSFSVLAKIIQSSLEQEETTWQRFDC